jgi:hypothetical protein
MRLNVAGGILAALVLVALVIASSTLFTVYQTDWALVVAWERPGLGALSFCPDATSKVPSLERRDQGGWQRRSFNMQRQSCSSIRGSSLISDPIISPGIFPRPSAAKFQVLQIRASLAMTRCRPASVPLDSE